MSIEVVVIIFALQGYCCLWLSKRRVIVIDIH